MLKKERVGGGYALDYKCQEGRVADSLTIESLNTYPLDNFVKFGDIEYTEEEIDNLRIINVKNCNGNSGYQITFTLGDQQCVIKKSVNASKFEVEKVIAKKAEEKKPVRYEIVDGELGLYQLNSI